MSEFTDLIDNLDACTDDQIQGYCTISKFFLDISEQGIGITANREVLEQVMEEAKKRKIEPEPVHYALALKMLSDLVMGELAEQMEGKIDEKSSCEVDNVEKTPE